MGSVDKEETMQGSGTRDREEESILVSVRMRPLNEKEILRNEVIDWECINDTTIVYKNHSSPERTMYPTSYTFDRVFRRDCSTRQVYEEGAKAVVLSAVNGINSSVFAYGQTSSGKTFTMSGITEYTMEDIFDYIQKHNEREFRLKFSALEIYNESVRDLLTADNSPLRLLDDPEKGTVVEKLIEETLRDWNHFKELLAVCEAQRQIGETFLNEVSSRSHQILRLTIESSTREYVGKNNSSTLSASLNFVDLAGSERASQALSAGSRLKEGSHINRSLLTLGTVIRKLSKGRTGHIPYRDSKLTRILQSSVGGNARTAIICTMSPARSYVEQSRNTLLFASCAKEVTTNAHVNVVVSDKALVRHLQRELARLQTELRSTSPSAKSDANDLLKEKDSKIEELERCVKELTVQLDLALTKIDDLQQQQGSEQGSPIWEGQHSSYPKLHVRQASISSSSDSITLSDHGSIDPRAMGTRQSPDRQSTLSYDENYSISDYEENQPPTSPYDQMFVETPSDVSSHMHVQPYPKIIEHESPQVTTGQREQENDLSEYDQYVGSEKMGEQSPNSYETDPYKVSDRNGEQTPDTSEVHSHQVSDGHRAPSPYFVEFDPYQVSYETGEQTHNSFDVDRPQVSTEIVEVTHQHHSIDPQQTPEPIEKQTDDNLEYSNDFKCIVSEVSENLRTNSMPPEEDGESLQFMDHVDIGGKENEPKEETKVINISSSSSLQDVIGSPGKKQVEVASEQKADKCIARSRNQSNDMNGIRLSFEGNVPCEIGNECEDGLDKPDVRLQDIQRKLSAQKYDANTEVLKISNEDVEIDDIPVTDIVNVSHKDHTENLSGVIESKGVTEPQYVDQDPKHQLVEDTMQKGSQSMKKIMKDVGLDPQDDLDTSTSSPLATDAKRIQEEIIYLWNTCNVSLVHRTYFFLLFFKGDPNDTIYMEVERRRLCFIKDSFSWGNSIDLDGQKLTPGSSQRSLHNERVMLGKLIKRRFPKQDRKSLYMQWGINLDSKRRSSQLAHRLWTETIDRNHILESANIVAKLLRFSAPRVPKEVFGLNLKTNLRRKQSRWMHSPGLLL